MGRGTVRLTLTSVFDEKGVKAAERALKAFETRAAEAGGASEMARKFAQASIDAETMGARIEEAAGRVAGAGDVMTAAVTAPLAGMAAAASTAAMDFESSMSRVAGALNDPSADISELRDLALEMGESTVFSASEAGAAMEELAKGGLTSAQIQAGALQTTMDLAAAGGMELSEAASAVVQSMGAFGLGAEQSSEAANALAGAAAASSADVSDLTYGLSQTSAQAHSAGWSIQDTTAVLAAFADAGIEGSDAGTSLKTMLQRLSAPTDEAAAAMEELGIVVRDENGEMLDATDMAQELSSNLGGLSSAQRDAAIQTIFGADASRAALIMTNQGADGLRRYTEATNDSEAAQRLANSQMGETERAVEEMKGAVETAAIQFGTALAPVVTDVAKAVGDAAEAFSAMDEESQRMAVGIAGAAAAAGPLLSVGGRIVSVVGRVAGAYGAASAKAAGLAVEFKKGKAAAGEGAGGLAKVAAGAKGVAEAMDLANKASGLLKATLVGMALDAIAHVVGDLASAEAHAQRLEGATSDLTGAFGAMADGAQEAAGRVAGELGNMGVSADECLEHQARLADEINGMWSDAGGSIAEAEIYAATIEQLADKTNLTAGEQAQLQSAVSGFNDVCGTSIGVIDPLNGKLSEQVDAVLAVKDAYVEQAKVQAAQETLVEVQKQQIENDIALAQAQQELANSSEGLYVAIGGVEVVSDEAGRKHHELEQRVSDLTAQQGACSEAVAMATGILEENANAVTASKDAVSGWCSSSEAFQQACSNAGVSADDLGTHLSQVGVSTSTLATLSAEQLWTLASNYDGSLGSIVGTIQSFGIESQAAAGQGATATTDAWSTTLSQMEPLTQGIGSSVVSTLSGTLDGSKAPAGGAGSGASSAFANGIGASQRLAATNAATMANTVRGWADLANSAYVWGSHVSSNFANGIAAGQSAAVNAAKRVADAVAAVLKHTVPKEGPLRNGGKGEAEWGEHAVENFAEGMARATRAASLSASGVAAAVASPMNAAAVPAPSVHQAHASPDRATLEELRALRDSTIKMLDIMEALFDGGFVVRRKGDGARVTAYAR